MKSALYRCDCGRNLSTDKAAKSERMFAYALGCWSCGQYLLIDVAMFEQRTHPRMRSVNSIDWTWTEPPP